MRSVVIDSSIALAWCFEDENNRYANETMEGIDEFLGRVPQVWALEVANALLMAERRGRITEEKLRRFASIFSELAVTIDDESHEHALAATLHIARRFRLTTYDASYVELAARTGASLATLDEQLRKAAEDAGVTVFEP